MGRKKIKKIPERPKKANPKAQSFGLVVVIIIVFVLGILTTLLISIVLSEYKISKSGEAGTGAFYVASAGIEEAIWLMQNNSTYANHFKEGTFDQNSGSFERNPALDDSSRYEVKITSYTIGAAEIISTGYYQLGPNTARREIRVDIAQATLPPPYDNDGAMFSHPAGGQSTGDLEFSSAIINIYGGSLHSGRDISFKASVINVEGPIKAKRNITNQQNSIINCNCFIDEGSPLCNSNPGCTYTITDPIEMPIVDFDAYRETATSQDQYFISENDFYNQTGFAAGTTKTFNGVVYIEGGITIEENRTLNMNGVIASSNSIRIGGKHTDGSLNLTRPAGQASGVLVKSGVTIDSRGDFSGSGLIYSGFRVDINRSNTPVALTGGILSRRVYVNSRTVNIYFDRDSINATLGDPETAPIIRINHWEEQY